MLENENRIISGTVSKEDIENDITLRPKWIEEYIGQDKVKTKLKIFIQAARKERSL